ncbi:putative cyclohexanone monooxygenase [Aspergillus steynii IBT 23096]|uniref:Putative cyclohexanone monooxygenase n=1 Tax=Aspergillus steynii IBT 23096 TaxID=1392250 RepID=A0A2I2G7S7_9EURO|nr:putative cyclohexanone monooxygenase [Aspergillus steynii IBT 23096]PLB48936.1 putative cyclohexanone monooxygenase [Aspergillus steynii IBT 23096]
MPQEHHIDALVVGTGFGGIYALHSLLQLGLNAKAIDKAGDVGGTWWWNQYPGAMSDTWSHLYRYTFDPELLQTYPWSSWYVTQPEILEYLRHVVQRYDLRPHMHLSTEMTSAIWDDDAAHWTVRCQSGDVFHARYLISALGILHQAHVPDFPGLSTFRGDVVHTGAWRPDLDLTGRRVGVVGVGSSGTQVVTAIADRVQSLHVFIRRPQYSVPSGNRAVTAEDRRAVNEQYPQIVRDAKASSLAMGFAEPARTLMSLPAADREQLLEDYWQGGNGLRFMFGRFSDVITDEAANEEVCRFLRRKIAAIVHDPAKRAILTPTDLFARRPLCDNGFYDRFNREHVFAVDVRRHPIERITPRGVRTADGTEHELDVLIFATGFDAYDGSYGRVDIRGRGGGMLREKWAQGPVSFLGQGVRGFPNLLMVNGPNGGFANVSTLSETNVEYMVDLVRHAEETSRRTGRPCVIEPTEQAEWEWTSICRAGAEGTLFVKVPQWLISSNIPGKPTVVPFFFGGLARLRAIMAQVKERGFEGYEAPFGTGKSPKAQL